MREHIILVAVSVTADSREQAENYLHLVLPQPTERDTVHVDSWWVAEDDRRDGSDCDSAVFVSPGNQSEASRVLYDQGLTPHINLVAPAREGGFQPRAGRFQ